MMNVIDARTQVKNLLDDYKKTMSNQLSPRVNYGMIKELELKFHCDRLVAELACHKVNFKNLELAIDFLYGHDSHNLHKHPFVPFQTNERELNPDWSVSEIADNYNVAPDAPQNEQGQVVSFAHKKSSGSPDSNNKNSSSKLDLQS